MKLRKLLGQRKERERERERDLEFILTDQSKVMTPYLRATFSVWLIILTNLGSSNSHIIQY